MADNVTLDAGSGGSVIATEDESSVHYQKVKLTASGSGTTANLSHAEDAVHTSGEHGLMALAVRNDTLAALAGTDGYYAPLQVNASGALFCALSSIAAGDNNIGNVDIVTLPSGNLGMRAMAASLSVTPASDITDGTYIGDIKFGEALPAGTALLGKVGIDQTTPGTTNAVAVTSVVAGVGATNLGKARASALGATDTGVAALAVRNDDLADLSGADGDYTPLQVNAEGALFVSQGTAEAKQKSGVAAGGAPGTDDMIAAVGGKKILVQALSLFATSATTNSVFIDNADNDLLGNTGNRIALSMDADADTVAGFILPYNPGGWFKTDAVAEAVTLNSSAAQDIIWCITYIETD